MGAKCARIEEAEGYEAAQRYLDGWCDVCGNARYFYQDQVTRVVVAPCEDCNPIEDIGVKRFVEAQERIDGECSKCGKLRFLQDERGNWEPCPDCNKNGE